MKRITAGRIAFAIISSFVIVISGRGLSFLYRPVGLVYLLLWIAYWLAQATRQRGTPSQYDKKQRAVYLAGVIYIPILIVVPPWEYMNFSGPIPRDGVSAFVGLILFAVGIVTMAAAMKALGHMYTSYLGIQPDHRLITTGPYRFVRHPGYLGEMLSMLGIGLALSSVIGIILAVCSVLLVLLRLNPEEEMLIAEFGDEYRDYMKKTSRLIPLVY